MKRKAGEQMRSPAELAVVALGSNQGASVQIIRRAMRQLHELSSDPLLQSSLYCTTPVNCPPGSPPFVNAVVALVPFPKETPECLLSKLRQMEKDFGRQPKQVRNEPRTLDLDLIAFGQERRQHRDLVLPHPRAHERRFVLAPLAEIAPDWVLPGQKHTIRQLLAALPGGTDECRKLTNDDILIP